MPDRLFSDCAAIDELRNFIQSEYAAQRRLFASRRTRPLQERVENGSCINCLCFQGFEEKGRALFLHEGNDSRLREGDAGCLSRGGADAGLPVWIYREEAGRIWLTAELGFSSLPLEQARDSWVLDERFVDLEGLYLDALDEVLRTAIGQERILPLLAGEAETGFDEEEFASVMAEMETSSVSWEDTQQEAIAGCLATDHCYLVQGPPGTGKTRVLAEVVGQLVERGERVLVTAFTHRAIDNALSATARRIGDREKVARFGAAVHRRHESYDSYESFEESPLQRATAGWVAASTPYALRRRLPGVEFDAVVIDESGQMTTPLAIMAMLSGRKYLFFGDEQQLGPVVSSEPRRAARYRGIFHTLRHHEVEGTRLDVSYRLNARLARWPSDTFYQGELSSAESAAHRRLAWNAGESMEDWVKSALDPDEPLVWLACPAGSHCTSNLDEVAVAAVLLGALRDGGVRCEEMAVVTPYRRQARSLRRRIETLWPGETGIWRTCVIDTVERMQGQEREVILLSLCASDPGFIANQADFLFDPRRLNVSATRSRTKLIIIASEALLALQPEDTDLEEEVELFRSLSASARRIPIF